MRDANNIVANGNISTDGDLIVRGVDEEGKIGRASCRERVFGDV